MNDNFLNFWLIWLSDSAIASWPCICLFMPLWHVQHATVFATHHSNYHSNNVHIHVNYFVLIISISCLVTVRVFFHIDFHNLWNSSVIIPNFVHMWMPMEFYSWSHIYYTYDNQMSSFAFMLQDLSTTLEIFV